MADPLWKERQGAGSCKERKIGVMWKDVTKDEESTAKARTPPPQPVPCPGSVFFSLLPGGFPGDESVSLPGGLLFSSWPLPGSSLTQPQPPVLPWPPVQPHWKLLWLAPPARLTPHTAGSLTEHMWGTAQEGSVASVLFKMVKLRPRVPPTPTSAGCSHFLLLCNC